MAMTTHERWEGDAFDPVERCSECHDEHGNNKAWPCEVVELEAEVRRLSETKRSPEHPSQIINRATEAIVPFAHETVYGTLAMDPEPPMRIAYEVCVALGLIEHEPAQSGDQGHEDDA